MKYVLLLERDKKNQDEICEALRKIDPEFVVKKFSLLEELAAWSMDVIQKDPKQIFEGDADPSVPLIILQREQLGTHFLGLLQKLRTLCIRKKFCKEEAPTGCVLTCFDDPELDRHQFEDKAITNVLFKPFDKLVLEQHLAFALPMEEKKSEGGGDEVYQMETKVIVEMLKDVDLLGISEWGFVTKSYLPIKMGKISKYYSELFDVGNHQHHVYGQCVNCTKFPNEEAYKVYFQFVGVEANVLNKIRKQMQQGEKESVPVTYTEKKGAPLRFRTWVFEDETREKYKTLIKDILPTATVDEVTKEMAAKDFKGFLPNEVVVTDPAHYAGVLKYAQPEQILVLCNEKYTDGFVTEAHGVKDILSLHADRKFLKNKVEFVMKYNNQMIWEVKNINKIIRVATLVNVNQVSEVAIVMTYTRGISLGAFRRFYLTTEQDPDPIPFTAACRKVEDQGKDGFRHLFVFFGITDTYLKRLRLWMRKAYIDENQESS